MGVRQHHRVDIAGLDAGFRHALLLAAGGRAERLRGAHAGVEQDQLVAGVHDRRVLLEHDIVGIEEVVGQHLLHFFLRHADEGARRDRRAAAGRRKRPSLRRRRERSGASRASGCRVSARAPARCRRAWSRRPSTGAERKQGPSRNIRRHASSSTVFDVICQRCRPDRFIRSYRLLPLPEIGKWDESEAVEMC